MIKYAVALVLTFFVSMSQAGSVQVPENCVNRVSPCLIRTEQSAFKFVQKNVEVSMAKESILKITAGESEMNFEIVAGYVGLSELQPSKAIYSFNGVVVDSKEAFAFRSPEKLEILSLNNFSFAQYKTSSAADSFPVRVKGEFINKKDLVQFTKNFFSDVSVYKKFLVRIEKDWKSEFKRQNISQTKALLRSIASQQQQEKEISDKKIQQEKELKKVRDNFFYRTFYR